MINNELLNVINLPITDHREIGNDKNYSRSLIEILEIILNKTVCNKLKRSIGKLNTPEIKMHNKMSWIASMIDIQLTYLFSKLDDRVIEIRFNTSENFVLETLPYKVIERYLTRTEIVLKTIAVRTIRAIEIDHG